MPLLLLRDLLRSKGLLVHVGTYWDGCYDQKDSTFWYLFPMLNGGIGIGHYYDLAYDAGDIAAESIAGALVRINELPHNPSKEMVWLAIEGV